MRTQETNQTFALWGELVKRHIENAEHERVIAEQPPTKTNQPINHTSTLSLPTLPTSHYL